MSPGMYEKHIRTLHGSVRELAVLLNETRQNLIREQIFTALRFQKIREEAGLEPDRPEEYDTAMDVVQEAWCSAMLNNLDAMEVDI